MVELSPEAVRVLTRTRELLQPGWIQGAAKSSEGQCLAWSVCCAADAHSAHTWGLVDEVEHILAREIGGIGLAQWNDTPGRTQEDVLRLLDGILARARK